jgi:potassium inwardly-rectifying channel subfamily J
MSKKHHKRVILKNGDCNVQLDKISNQRSRYLADIFTTLVDAQWRYTLGVFACSFVLSWAVFAVVWLVYDYYSRHCDIMILRT